MFRNFLLVLFISFFPLTSNAADVSNIFKQLIPGEGLTEASIQINEDDKAEIEILALRNIQSKKTSNFFNHPSFFLPFIKALRKVTTTIDNIVILKH